MGNRFAPLSLHTALHECPGPLQQRMVQRTSASGTPGLRPLSGGLCETRAPHNNSSAASGGAVGCVHMCVCGNYRAASLQGDSSHRLWHSTRAAHSLLRTWLHTWLHSLQRIKSAADIDCYLVVQDLRQLRARMFLREAAAAHSCSCASDQP